jgi:hypothetical protein
MNQFLYATAFMGGLAWFGGECMILSANGSPWWFVLFFLAFLVAFVVLGCLNISDTAINRFGALVSVLLSAGLIIFALRTTVLLAQRDFDGSAISHWWPAAVKIFGAIIVATLTRESFRSLKGHHNEPHAEAHS